MFAVAKAVFVLIVKEIYGKHSNYRKRTLTDKAQRQSQKDM